MSTRTFRETVSKQTFIQRPASTDRVTRAKEVYAARAKLPKLAKPIIAWALKSHGVLRYEYLFETRADALAAQNKPAGERVVPVKISEVRE